MMPGFLQRQSDWIQGEYRKYMARGVDKKRMRVSFNCEGTMYFIIDDKPVTMYSINY